MPTLLARINYSESRRVNESPLNDGAYHPIEDVNKLFSVVDASNKVKDMGYDKTGFSVLVWEGSDDDLSEYDGRIDLGDGYSNPSVLQDHITMHCEGTLGRPYFLPNNGEGAEGEKYVKELNWWLTQVA